MNRIEIDVITNQREVIELTAEEIATAQTQYAQWQTSEINRVAELPNLLAEQIATLQAQLNELQGVA
jgi:hypothetical protein